jgi:hypothetical protein
MTGGLIGRWLDSGALDVPLPGSGDTMRRWRHLAELAEVDLVAARLAEAHTDAIASWPNSVESIRNPVGCGVYGRPSPVMLCSVRGTTGTRSHWTAPRCGARAPGCARTHW